MIPLSTKGASNRDDLKRVSQAAGVLTQYACTISARHINDGMLRLQFNREVAYYMREIVRDVESGKKSVEDGITAIKAEQRNLSEQSVKIVQQGFGLTAGVFQVIGGAAMCLGSLGFGCVTGVVTAIHGG